VELSIARQIHSADAAAAKLFFDEVAIVESDPDQSLERDC
jgi:hypothetical protein